MTLFDGFDPATASLLDGKNFATLATVNPDGGPQTSVVWFEREGDTVLISVTSGRKKARNIQRDPRVSLTVFDLSNPYRSAEIRGTAELLPDPDKELPKRLSQRYLGEAPLHEMTAEIRLIVRVTPERVNGFVV
ncbi:PPOX class F420-dependent oxidoreductase [Streptomyces sp. NBC_00316]|uniref:PPOX class F420-dependent oxidoreductase n=1 Tax=Streptomyces sp. NBC_00316 TaxID=2975710 RepID=UPI002E2AD569|nr:PPOX class F420-dependent oxidoreductase [Streptomyces sp. NBC_00316]